MNQNKNISGVWFAALAFVVVPAVFAQPVSMPGNDAAEIQRRQEQEIEAQRARAAARPDILSSRPAVPGPADTVEFPEETPCFLIDSVDWDGFRPPAALRHMSDIALGRCVGLEGLRGLQERMMNRLIDAGLITSRVLIPEQSLASGTLTLRYVPGRISGVRDVDMPGWWRTVLPTWPGGQLDQRDLDQALENIRRLAGQADAAIDIAPGPEAGDSDIILRPGTGKRWHGYVGGDNAGLDNVGTYQVNAGLTLDSPLFLYDQLSVAWNSNARWRSDKANTRAASINYSLPFGYWTAFFSASRSTYRQTVAGFDAPIIYGGTTRQVQGGLSWVAYRGSAYKGTLTASLSRKRVSSTLNDEDIDVQRRDVTGYEIGFGHRHYVGPAVLDAGFGVRGNLRGMSDRPGFVYGDPDWDGRSTILMASAGLYLPWQMAGRQWAYQGNWQIQHARTPLVPSDYFTIGSRYAVRGFDGQMTLAAEDGWTLRNDLSLSLGDSGQQLYAGVDAGHVGGPSARDLSGRTLVGAVAGWRGRVAMPWVNASYDLSAGWPLKKPAGLQTDHTVFAATLMFEF